MKVVDLRSDTVEAPETNIVFIDVAAVRGYFKV